MGDVHPFRESDDITVYYHGHPPRTDSPEYRRSRQWMRTHVDGGCFVCGGPADMSHPEAPASGPGYEDHHGAPLYWYRDDGSAVLVGFGLAPIEWVGGWGASPSKVQAFAQLHHEVQQRLAPNVDHGPAPGITTTDDVMAWVDSPNNGALRLCSSHHSGSPSQHTPDINGHEAVGIHHVPLPIWALQVTHDWAAYDLFAGTTGTVVVARPREDGSTLVLYADAVRKPTLARRIRLQGAFLARPASQVAKRAAMPPR